MEVLNKLDFLPTEMVPNIMLVVLVLEVCDHTMGSGSLSS